MADKSKQKGFFVKRESLPDSEENEWYLWTIFMCASKITLNRARDIFDTCKPACKDKLLFVGSGIGADFFHLWNLTSHTDEYTCPQKIICLEPDKVAYNICVKYLKAIDEINKVEEIYYVGKSKSLLEQDLQLALKRLGVLRSTFALLLSKMYGRVDFCTYLADIVRNIHDFKLKELDGSICVEYTLAANPSQVLSLEVHNKAFPIMINLGAGSNDGSRLHIYMLGFADNYPVFYLNKALPAAIEIGRQTKTVIASTLLGKGIEKKKESFFRSFMKDFGPYLGRILINMSKYQGIVNDEPYLEKLLAINDKCITKNKLISRGGKYLIHKINLN